MCRNNNDNNINFETKHKLNSGELAMWYMLNNKQILILEATTVGILNVGYVVYKIRQSQTNKYLFLYTAYMCSWLSRKLPV